MERAEVDDATGEVLKTGYICGFECCGCSCHISAPCNHCYLHWFEKGENVNEDER